VQLGESEDAINNLIAANVAITARMAERLESALGVSASFWLKREAQYRKALERLSHGASGTLEEAWLDELPLRDMIEFGWVKRAASTSEQVRECMRFFGVANLDAWRDRYGGVFRHVAFRTSPAFAQRPAAVAAWLRSAEIQAIQMRCANWDPSRFRNSLTAARALTRQRNPKDFLPALRRLCAESGVALPTVRAPNGCRASGAARFLDGNKALLILSFRYLSDDHFWFTFFHEAGHLLLHSRDAVFIDGKGLPDRAEEKEANAFAADVLVPPGARRTLDTLALEKRAVRHFALEIGVSPGIIVGQLQHAGRLTHARLNHLKVRYSWSE
jgi:hypothetical protein